MRDRDRPPVLAHQRFDAARDELTALPLAERFAQIHATNLWSAASSVSGLGSEREATAALRRELPALLKALGIVSLLDAPCGDGEWIADALPAGLRYTGVDIVPALIEANAARHGGRSTFLVADIIRDQLPRADAVLCRDCLVHLSFANIGKAIANLRRSGARWLLTTTFPAFERNMNCEDGDWRALNFEVPPFNWPAPTFLIDEECEEAGGGWRDKSLGVWEFAAIPD